MATQQGTSGNVRFGQFEFNRQTGELRRNGSRIKLQEQPGQILAALLEAPGDLVSREELRRRLWDTETFVDFDHSLNTAIKRLRDTLGDSADNPIFVETLSRRGYRFMAPVIIPANGQAIGNGNGHKNGNALLQAGPVSLSAMATTGKWSFRFLWWG